MAEVVFEVDQTSLATVQTLTIGANFEEVKAALMEMMEPYKGLAVTEDDMGAAKTIRARIRKVTSRIEETRKSVKREYQTPLAEFEKRCKELTAICEEAATNIDDQIKALEAAQKKAKEQRLIAVFNHLITERPEVLDYITFPKIFDPRWLNATYSEAQANTDMAEAIESAYSDICRIKELKSPYETALLDIYKQTRDFSAVMYKAMAFQQRDQEEQRKREEAEAREHRIADERAAIKEAEARLKEATSAVQEVAVVEDEQPVEHERVYQLTFRAVGTKEQLSELSQYMREKGIRFERA